MAAHPHTLISPVSLVLQTSTATGGRSCQSRSGRMQRTEAMLPHIQQMQPQCFLVFLILQTRAATGDQRGDWRQKLSEQKRLDMETFGGLGGVRHHSFGRGRGGGRGGMGGRGGPPGRVRALGMCHDSLCEDLKQFLPRLWSGCEVACIREVAWAAFVCHGCLCKDLRQGAPDGHDMVHAMVVYGGWHGQLRWPSRSGASVAHLASRMQSPPTQGRCARPCHWHVWSGCVAP
eukprot:1138920-Pelagomonas_calceolata.AAC.2